MSGTKISDAPDAGPFNGSWRIPLGLPASGPLSTSAAVLRGYGSIQQTFAADGQFAFPIPAGALITGGKIVPNTPTGATISLGTTSGGSDVFPATVVPGSVPYGLQGVNFLQWIWPIDQIIFAHSPSWASMTITIWFNQ